MSVFLDKLLVKFHAWDDARVDEILSSVGGKVTCRLPVLRWAHVEIDHGRASEVMQALLAHPEVETAEFQTGVKHCAVTQYHASGLTNAVIPWQHAFARMNVFRAWRYTKGAGATLVVVDSGLTINTDPAWGGRTVARWSAVHNTTEAPYVEDNIGDLEDGGPLHHHGTACLSVAGASLGVTDRPAGVAPEANLVMINAYAVDGACSNAAMYAALLPAVDRYSAKIVSLSMAEDLNVADSPALWATRNTLAADTLAYLRDHGACLLAAASNEGQTTDGVPDPERIDPYGGEGAYPAEAAPSYGGFNVACTGPGSDKPISYTNYGPRKNLATPGDSMLAVAPQRVYPGGQAKVPAGWVSEFKDASESGGNYVSNMWWFNGTSSATPLAAGVCVLVSSANPTLTGPQIRDIVRDTSDLPTDAEFLRKLPNAGIANAARAVLKGLSLVPDNLGRVYPYANFFGSGVRLSFDTTAGTATTHLTGMVSIELDAFSSDTVTNVQLWAGTSDLIYSGPPCTTRAGPLLSVAAARFAGKTVRIVASTSTTTAEEEYSDVIGYANASAPTTKATNTGGVITLSAVSENGPVAIYYRWNTGTWNTYAAPFPAVSGTLQFYGVDSVGNIEGGTHFAGG